MLGTATIVVIGLFVRKLAGNTAGIVAAAITAVYPQIWISDGMVMSETAVIFATVVALSAIYLFWREPRLRNAVLMGAACSFATLTRSELVLLFPLVVLPLALLVRDVDWGRRFKLLVVAGLAGAIVLGPWVVYNLTRFAEPVDHHRGPGRRPVGGELRRGLVREPHRVLLELLPGTVAAGGLKTSPNATPSRGARRSSTRRTTSSGSRWWLPRASAGSGALFKPGQTTAFDWWIEGRGRAASWTGLFMYYALVPFGIYGLVLMRRRRIPIIPMLAILLTTTFAAAVTFGVTRYRAPSEVVIVSAAAIGIAACWTRWRSRARGGHRQVHRPPRDRTAPLPRPPVGDHGGRRRSDASCTRPRSPSRASAASSCPTRSSTTCRRAWWPTAGASSTRSRSTPRARQHRVVDTALHPPLYTSLLAIPARFGIDSMLSQRVMTSLLGAATVFLLGHARARHRRQSRRV